MNKPMFFFTGVYETVAQAETDYDAIKALHVTQHLDGSDFQEAEAEAMRALDQQERVAATV
ncbi:MAG TPA: hypothetical protein VNT55_07405 [Baekduia sp.]|nr:hypothetical protein [Baekduia sp.]